MLRRVAWLALFAAGMAILHLADIIEPEEWS